MTTDPKPLAAPLVQPEKIDWQALYSGKKAADANMEVSRLTCEVCGGLQEGCTCPEVAAPLPEPRKNELCKDYSFGMFGSCNNCGLQFYEHRKLAPLPEIASPLIQCRGCGAIGRPMSPEGYCGFCNGSPHGVFQKEMSVAAPVPLGEGDRLQQFQERILFEHWYAANRMGLYLKYSTRLRMAIEDTARAAWFEGRSQEGAAK